MSMDIRLVDESAIDRIGEQVRNELTAQQILGQITMREFMTRMDKWLAVVAVWVKTQINLAKGGADSD